MTRCSGLTAPGLEQGTLAVVCAGLICGEDNFSFALYAGGGSFALSRPLTNSIPFGEFDIVTRFDLAGSGPNLINLRAGNDTSTFGSGELLSFGIINGNQLSYTDGAGFHALPSGEARGSVWGWNIDFDAAAGTYSGSVTNLGGGFAAFFNGNLEASSTSVGSFGVINSSAGNNQSLIFDTPTFSVVPYAPPARPVLVKVSHNGQTCRFSFLTQTGHTYTVESWDTLAGASWRTNATILGNGSIANFTETNATNSSRFYRVGAR